jgi:hypothetical protein
MTKIDEVSEILGRLDEKTDNLMVKVDSIDIHLKELNGTVSKHQSKMVGCDERFSSMEGKLKGTQWDYKFWVGMTGLVSVITVILHSIGL